MKYYLVALFDEESYKNLNPIQRNLSKKFRANRNSPTPYIPLEIIENPNNLAVLQHCTSGKDRTGLGSALILLILGVPEEKVIEDYMLSNEYRKGENHRILQIYEKHVSNETIKELIEGILGVKKKFIELSLNKIKNTYGSYETYFLKEYGLTKEKIEFLRNEYLY